ncbi:peroxisomal 2,4- dienoyl-CoA reductase and sorbitol utilization protein [Scheffersomyces stipitis CBS 6054]|uniref:Peroxisomal 2,4-dienoyl-CoA reductase and sorbitol utilization protein n=1 Tax=Scheffersomyces stipitis (strain ATCC 58785 / CBS 6054 / NBRC 10063 / NRRL Y-11545) TaxID=322104 RepID=A3GF05_PICST|nr:peroxisomal 2,4- dienoyl-CoA reductase and sorbitol utilization protein [Scheffersomyces stipitis CBS 6054]EAZ63262.1 peroxisomal 2,4- dienoyl-CoA reductase and sorbitol utilization protein [Scheffersomyces stipitis CBS 6054]
MTVETATAPQSMCNTDIGSLPAADPVLPTNVLDFFKLDGKTAAITGGARGIGYAISEAYLQAGISKLAIIDYAPNEAALDELRSRFLKSTIVYHNCDVRKADQVKSVIDKIEEEFKVIDIFVANAGIAWTSGPMIDQETDDDWHNVMNVDLNGVYYCAKNIGKIFRKQGKGSLVMTASMSAHIVNVPQLQAAYNAAKAGVLHLGKSLAVEWAPFARVNTVSPGYISTELSDFVPTEMKNKWYALTPQGRQGAPRELCGAYLYLASDASTYTTGSDIRVDGGYCSV